MIVMESDSTMMTAYAATSSCSHSPFVKALLTPDVRMKPRPIFVPAGTNLSMALRASIGRTFGTPSLGCLTGRLVWS